MVTLAQSKLAIWAFSPREFTWAQDNELTRLLWRDMLKNYTGVDWNDFIGVEWDDDDVPALMTEMVVQARHRHNVIFHKQRKNWKDVTQRTTKAAFEVEYSLALYFHLKDEGAGSRLTKKVHRAQFTALRQKVLEKRADYIPPVGVRMASIMPSSARTPGEKSSSLAMLVSAHRQISHVSFVDCCFDSASVICTPSVCMREQTSGSRGRSMRNITFCAAGS